MSDFNILNLPMYSLTEFSSAVIVINILATFFIALTISWVYQKTHFGISYSKSFLTTLIIMAVLSSVAMMILSNNLVRALGVLGIFSLIRFRTIIKDTRDVAFLFFVLAIGMALGTNNYVIAFLATPVISLAIYLLFRFDIGSIAKEGFLLTMMTSATFENNSEQKLFNEYLVSSRLLQMKTHADGEREYYFTMRFKNEN